MVHFYWSRGVATLIQASDDKYLTLTKSVCHPSDGLTMNMMPLEDAPSPHLALWLSFKCAMCSVLVESDFLYVHSDQDERI